MRLLAYAFAWPLMVMAAVTSAGNGLTVTTVMAWMLAALPLMVAFKRWRVVGALLAAGAIWVATRLIEEEPTALERCVNERCGPQGVWWSRVLDERETTRAGIRLAGLAGVLDAASMRRFDSLVTERWRRAPPTWVSGGNASLMRSTAQSVELLRYRAQGHGPRPCVVFLHGFGGLLTPYVQVLVEGTGGTFDVIAPALGLTGEWWTSRGQEVIARTLELLPPEVDRSAVYLVGLSNGGVGATRVLSTPLAARFAGVVLVSGVGTLPRHVPGSGAPPLLVVSGEHDDRFTPAWVDEASRALAKQGFEVSSKHYASDHFLVLSEPWVQAFVQWSMR